MDKYEVLKEYFGYSTFRKGQEEIIDNILSGRDVLAVMPTGAGKSICYQVPALMLNGITIVVSPLISLMKDQVIALNDIGVKATYINSSMSRYEYIKAINMANNGYFKIVYVAPERLENPEFLYFANTHNISMVTVDEAHCVSQWGHDFRPSYLKISNFIQQLSKRPIVSSFTATATEKVKQDIMRILNLNTPYTITTGFDRKNLFFEVKHPDDKLGALLNIVAKRRDKFGIVYCGTRKNVEKVCEELQNNGYSALKYHAGLKSEERTKNQEEFIYDRCNIMVATNAFGMGIDKSNISYIVHYNMPKNIESYYQEAGRAGRDGEPADCILLFSASDVSLNRFLIDNSKNDEIPPETLEQIKRKEKELLKYMTFYCTINSCLRHYILNYFGESSRHSCMYCGNCLSNYEDKDITIDSQKILSCVYWVHQRCSIPVICQILKGSSQKSILENDFDKLSTYGIMKEQTEKYIREVINELVLHNYLDYTTDRLPVLRFTKKSKGVLVGDTKVYMKVYKGNISKKEVSNSIDERLFKKLQEVRTHVATVQSIPTYVVFSDATLKDMCRKLPTNKDEFIKVSGVGEIKLKKYSREFLKAINEYKSNNTNL